MFGTFSEFIAQCEKVADETGCELIDTYLDGRGESFEDDGTLHVVRGSYRGAFDVSEVQRLSRKEQDANTKRVLKRFGLKFTPNCRA